MSAEISFKAVNLSLNLLGYIPVVSSFSSQLRQSLGITKVITGIVVSILMALTIINISWPMITSNLLIGGFLDVFRSYIERFPVIGNVACIIYDLAKEII